jgi:putative ABC transport system permease protein
VTLDLRVVVFALVISVATGLLAGLLPAFRASRRNLIDSLKASNELSAGGPGRLLGLRLPGAHDLLISAQVALAVVLLFVAGLVLRTFGSVQGLDPGFAYDNLVVTHISTSSTTLKPEEREKFFRDIAARLSEEPWVRAATVADVPPLSPHSSAEFLLDGQTDASTMVYSNVIPGFFEGLEIEVVNGRGFVESDTAEGPSVAVVNESLVKRFFEGTVALGRRLRWPAANNGEGREYEIVGVVRDTKTRDYFDDPEPTVYLSYPQHRYPTGSALLVSAKGDPSTKVLPLQRWLREYEPHLAIINVVTYSEIVRGFMYTQRMNAELFSVLAFFGLGMATVGIFSVMSLVVSRRTREIGIRISVGAQRGDIGMLVLRRALVPVGLGLGVGLAGSFAIGGLVRGLLFGVEPTDPMTLAAGTGVLVVAALSAAYLPARRASRVDPVIALRHE